MTKDVYINELNSQIKKIESLIFGEKLVDQKEAVASFHLYKAKREAAVIICLCTNDFIPEAKIQLRSLINLTINLVYLIKTDSWQRYLRSEAIGKKQQLKILQKYYPKLYKERIKAVPKIDEAFEKFKNEYKPKALHRGWSDLSIREMAVVTEVDYLVMAYDVVYKMHSDIEHTNALSVNEYLESHPEGARFIDKYDDDDIISTTGTASSLIKVMIDEYTKRFSEQQTPADIQE